MPEKRESLATQKFVEIAGVKNGTLILKSGGLRQILMVGGINFDLKSDEEQAIIINLFQSFLNSLNFSVQLIVHSRRLNIDSYLVHLTERGAQESNELLRNQIEEYREFIRAFVAENAIMNKTYFVVVPFDLIKIPGLSAVASSGGLMGLFKRTRTGAAENAASATADRELDQAIEQLAQRTAHVTNGLDHIGLRVVPLNDEELIELFYNLYNPEGIEKKELGIMKEETEAHRQ